MHIFASDPCCQLIHKFSSGHCFHSNLSWEVLISFQNAHIFQGISKNFKSSELQQVTTYGISDISYGGLKSLELKLLLFCRSKAKKIKRLCVIFLVLFVFFFWRNQRNRLDLSSSCSFMQEHPGRGRLQRRRGILDRPCKEWKAIQSLLWHDNWWRLASD